MKRLLGYELPGAVTGVMAFGALTGAMPSTVTVVVRDHTSWPYYCRPRIGAGIVERGTVVSGRDPLLKIPIQQQGISTWGPSHLGRQGRRGLATGVDSWGS